MPSGVPGSKRPKAVTDRLRREYMAARRAADPVGVAAKKRIQAGLPKPTRQQADRCEICGNVPWGLIPAHCVTHLDHSHNTGMFRGWLCFRCNIGLGNFNDSPALLRAAADYIERTEWTPDGQTEQWLLHESWRESSERYGDLG